MTFGFSSPRIIRLMGSLSSCSLQFGPGLGFKIQNLNYEKAEDEERAEDYNSFGGKLGRLGLFFFLHIFCFGQLSLSTPSPLFSPLILSFSFHEALTIFLF